MSTEGFLHLHEDQIRRLGVCAQTGKPYQHGLAEMIAASRGNLELLQRLRGRVKLWLATCEMPEAALPDKLNDPANAKLAEFYKEVIHQLDKAMAA